MKRLVSLGGSFGGGGSCLGSPSLGPFTKVSCDWGIGLFELCPLLFFSLIGRGFSNKSVGKHPLLATVHPKVSLMKISMAAGRSSYCNNIKADFEGRSCNLIISGSSLGITRLR